MTLQMTPHKRRGLPLAMLLALGSYAATSHAAQLYTAIQPSGFSSKLAKASAVPQNAVADDQSLYVTLSLPLRNEASLDRLLTELQDPSTPNYHKYLSPQVFADRFGASASDLKQAIAWAGKQGFDVVANPTNRLSISIRGKAADVNRAFHITLQHYQVTDGQTRVSRQVYAPDREPSTDLGIAVRAISGLDDINPPESRLSRRDPLLSRATANAGGSGPSGNFTPDDIRAAYYGSGPLTGKGQTVAIFSNAALTTSDLDLFYKSINQSRPATTITKVPVNGFVDNNSGASNGEGENILDIANVLGVAPQLDNILFYEGARNAIPAILDKIASDNKASVISNSWIYNIDDSAEFKEFQVQGQSFVSSSGDEGAHKAAEDWGEPGSNPYITNVGGTHLETTSAGGAWKSESAWAHSGGGYLADYDKANTRDFYPVPRYLIPAYQQLPGVISASNEGSQKNRNDPDIALEADYDNITAEGGKLEQDWGGTSFAAPRLAGLLALANEASAARGGQSVGFINPRLYQLGTGAAYSSQFHDVTSGSNPGTRYPSIVFYAVPGFDLTTGWGSPIGPAFIDGLIAP